MDILSELKRKTDHFVSGFLEFFIAILLSWMGFAILFIILSFVWTAFLETPVGSIYYDLNPDRSSDISHVVNQSIIDVSWTLFSISLIWSLFISSIAHFLSIGRQFTYSTHMSKLIIWILPFIVLIGSKVKAVYSLNSWPISLLLVTFPAAVSLIYSMKFCESITPNITQAKRFAMYLIDWSKNQFNA